MKMPTLSNNHQKLISQSDLKVIEGKIELLETQFPIEIKIAVHTQKTVTLPGVLRALSVLGGLLEFLAFRFLVPIPGFIVLAFFILMQFLPNQILLKFPYFLSLTSRNEKREAIKTSASKVFESLNLNHSPSQNCVLLLFSPQDQLFYVMADKNLSHLLTSQELLDFTNSCSSLLKEKSFGQALNGIAVLFGEFLKKNVPPLEAPHPSNHVSNALVFLN
jgi:hypothetical protein